MKAKITILFTFILMPFVSMAQWTIQSTGFTSSLRSLENIWVVDENTVWASAKDGSGNDSIIQEFTRTVDGGATWTPGTINNAAGLSASMIFGLDSSTAWIAMYDPNNDGGKILKTTDGGLNWTHQSTAIYSSAAGAYPNTVYFWNANEGFCMGDPTNNYFEIYTTSNGGTLWSRVDSANMPPIVSGEYGYAAYLSVVDTMVWFGTNKGRIFKSHDKGRHWTLINTPFTTSGKIRFLQFKDSLNGIIGNRTNNSFTMYSTSDGGTSWQAISPTGNVYGNNVVLVEGTANTLISSGNATAFSGSSISRDYGANWTDIPGSTGMAFSALSNFKNQTGWAGLKNQSSTVGGIAKLVLHSKDAGLMSLVEPINPCEGIHNLRFLLKNYGDGILDSVTIQWKVDTTSMNPIHHQTHLAAGQTEVIDLGPFNFVGGMSYDFEINTANPNGLQDEDVTNDSLTTTISVNPKPIVFIGNDTMVNNIVPLVLNAGVGFQSYLWSNGDTTQYGYFNLDTIINNVIVWVEVTDSNGCIGRDTMVVTVIDGFADNINSKIISIHPNPSNGKFELKSSARINEAQIIIYDLHGRIVISDFKENFNDLQLDLSTQSKGVYFIKIISNKLVVTKKLILD